MCKSSFCSVSNLLCRRTEAQLVDTAGDERSKLTLNCPLCIKPVLVTMNE